MALDTPDIYIIESVDLENEAKGEREGEVLTEILKLSGKSPRYVYIRTKQELIHFLKDFQESGYRYLHLSCHGNSQAIGTTFDTISFQELGDLLGPYLQDRRLFVSACSVVNDQFRQDVMTGSGCLSTIGPSKDVAFDQAAIFWASFYYLMFDSDTRRMKRDDILPTVKKLARLFELPITYCSRTRTHEIG